MEFRRPRFSTLTAIYILCCIVVANLPSPAYQCDYQYPNTEQSCHPHDPKFVQSLFIEGVRSVGEWGHDDWIAAGTVVIAIFTVVLAISTIFLWLTTRSAARNQACDMKDSIDAAKRSADIAKNTLIASHRAWLKVDVLPSELVFRRSQGMWLGVKHKIENVGNAPATNVQFHSWLYAGTNCIPPLRDRSLEVRREQIMGGFALLPGEHFPQFTGYSNVIDSSHLKTAEVDEMTDGYGRISLYVLVCVDYTFPSDPETHHQVQFAYELKRADEMPITVTEGVIKGTDLKFGDVGLGLTRFVD